MLIVYRTNQGFAGDIVVLDPVTPAAAMDVYLAQPEAPEIAYLDIQGGALAAETLGALIASVGGYGQPGRFYVAEVDGVMSLVDGGA